MQQSPSQVETIKIPFEELVEDVDVKVNVDSKPLKENESLKQGESTEGWAGSIWGFRAE